MRSHALVETKQPDMNQTAAHCALRRSANGAAASPQISAMAPRALKSPGDQMDSDTRSFMESRFGHDFSRVRVHSDAQAAASARAVSARAYTVGRDVVFGHGQYAPQTGAGRRLIAHELTHVVQQSGVTSSSPQRLSIAPASGGVEAEARIAAAVVAGGGTFRPQIRTGIGIARQSDAGVPADAGPAPAPGDAGVTADAGPSPGAPGPAPAQRPPPAVRATFGAVTFGASVNRVPPTKIATAAVTVTGLPAGGAVDVDVEGSGGPHGTASIVGGARLTGSGTVTVKGNSQTAPGNARALKLRARIGTSVIARSPGFTVAAYPISYSDRRVRDVNTASAVGVVVQDGWKSDGSGSIAELDEVKLSERVDIQSRDNPPFTSAAGTSATSGTSGYLAANALSTDTHTYAKANIVTRGLAFGDYTLVYGQLSLFQCNRTGVTDVVMPDSGFTITHKVKVLNLPIVGRSVGHTTVKTGAAVTVEGRAATAGSGTASSDVHIL